MATLNMVDQMTALELAKRAGHPDPFYIIELMRETNEFLIDAPMYECNNGTRNTALQRTIQAVGEHRIYNRGVGKVATQTKEINDRIAILGAYAEVDEDMVRHTGNIEQARRSEYMAIVKGMGLTQANTIIHGIGEKDDEFSGLMERRNKIGELVIDAGGTNANNDMTSIYLVAFGQEYCHMIYPKGSKSCGVERIDNGIVQIPDPNTPGKKYEVYQDKFRAEYGITIKVPESVIRIANIPKDMSGDVLIDKLIDASYKVAKGASTYALYSNDSVLIKLDKASSGKANVVHTLEDPWGKPITHFRNFRCRNMDVITNAEGIVA